MENILLMGMEKKLRELEARLNAEQEITVEFHKLTENAIMPRKAIYTDLGMDIWTNATETTIIRPCSKHIFKTGLAPIIPEGWGLEVADRSSMGSKGIKYLAGEIDQEYHGEIGIILANINSDRLVVISDQEKSFVEKTKWFDYRTRQFVMEEPTQEEVDKFIVLKKEVIVVKYLKDALAQMTVARVPKVNIVEASLERLEQAMEVSERKANGYGHSDSTKN